MNPSGLEYHKIEGIQGFLTNVDPSRTPQNYAEDMAGCRLGVEDRVMDRDFGTRHIWAAANYPSGTLVEGAPFYNIDTGYTQYLTAMEDSNGYVHLFLDTSATGDGSSQLNLTGELLSTTINGAPSGANVVLTSVTGLPAGDDSIIGYILLNSTRSTYYIAKDYTESTKTVTLLASNSHGWQSGDTVKVYATKYAARYWDRTIGVSPKEPHLRFAPMDNIRKMAIAIGSVNAAGVITAQRPALLCRRHQVKNLFYASSSALYSRAATHYDLEPYGGMALGFQEDSGLNSPRISTASPTDYTATLTTYDSIAWGTIKLTVSNDAVLGFAGYLGMMATAVIDGYGETDPIWYAVVRSADASTLCQTDTTLTIDPAAMPSGLTRINIYTVLGSYGATSDELTTQFADPANWECFFQIDLNAQNVGYDWSAAGTTSGTMSIGPFLFSYTTLASKGTLSANLGRPMLLKSQAPISPRYIGISSRNQSSIVVIDKDDSTLRTSAIDGYGAHAEMIFPEQAIDNSGYAHSINLLGTNTMLGLSQKQDTLFVFRNTELLIRDNTSGYQRVVPADVLASKTIVDTPYGVVFAGKSAIYLMRSGDLEPQVINGSWVNHYDGRRVYTYSDATPYISDTNRAAAIAGYDPYFREYLIQINTYKGSSSYEHLTYRYSFDRKTWSIRYWNLGTTTAAIAFFGIRKDNSLLIGASSLPSGETAVPALLYYPVTTGTLFEDILKSDGTTNGKGIRTHAKINLGSITEHVRQGCPYDILMNCHGVTVTGTPTATLGLYANQNASVFNGTTTFAIPAQSQNIRRFVPNYGPMESMQVRIDVTTADILKISRFHLNSLWVGITKNTQRTGNT